jgi:hypothetical protein
MVKFEGIVVLGLWGLILLAGRSSRAQFWPLQRIGWGIVVALLFWLPYAVFRLKGPVAHPESAWLSEFFHNIGTVLQIAPMTWVAFVSRRFFNNEFVVWSAPDNQNAVWDGKWTGLESLVDQATLGIGWLCLFLVVAAWWRGGQVRWTLIRLFLLFLVFASFIAIVWSSARSNPLNYTNSLAGSDRITGGRYLYPVLMSWFVAGTVVLMRSSSGGTKTSPPRNGERRRNQPGQ